jgi:hypothetical protein
VVNGITIRGRDQVMIHVAFAEMDRDLIKQFGVNLSGQLSTPGGAAVLNFNNVNNFSVNGGPLNAANNFTGKFGSVTGTLQAMERAGVTRILAEPTLTAISGESAHFLAGGEFPYPIPPQYLGAGPSTEDRKRMGRLGGGSQLDDWLAFGPGLLIRRRLAKSIVGLAETDEAKGRPYSRAFKEQMEMDGLYDRTTNAKSDVMKSTFTAVLWLYDDEKREEGRLEILREIRSNMTPGQQARFNSPISAQRRVLDELRTRGLAPPKKARAPKQTDDEVKRERDEFRELLCRSCSRVSQGPWRNRLRRRPKRDRRLPLAGGAV